MALTGATDGYEPDVGKGPATRWLPRLTSSRLNRVHITSTTIAMLAGLVVLQVVTAVLFVTSTASGESSGWDRLPTDDAWFRMTYIRNFAESFTFEFNSGEAATGGTSPLWIALNGTLAAVFGLESGSLPGLTKVVGILFAALTAWMVFRVTWQITRRRYVGLLAGAIIAVEPNFGFAAVSGTEVTLFAAVSLLASWAFLRGHIRTAGVFTALAIAARPEGLLLAFLIVGATMARWIWRRDGVIFEHRQDVHDIAWLALPSMAISFAWVVFNWSVTGSALPDSYLATNEVLGLMPLSNLWNAWLGYLHEQTFMDGLAWLVGLPLIVAGMLAVFKRHSFSAVPLALFSLAMIYAAMVTFTRPDAVWLFEDRRHIDPALPFIVILLITGMMRAWQAVWAWKRVRNPLTERERKAVVITVRVAIVAIAVAPLIALPTRWDALTTEYSWSSRNTNEVHVAMAKWLDENTPQNAVIGAIPAGAIGFFTDREILDLSGKNTHDAQGTPALTYGLEQRVDYLVAFRGPFFDSVAGRSVVNEQRVAFGNPYTSNMVRAYGPDGSAAGVKRPRELFAVFDQASLGFDFRIIDSMDTGNGLAVEEQSEVAHDYGIDGERTSYSFTARVDEDSFITDDARVFRVAEEFSIVSEPGVPTTIVKRYDASVAGSVRVFVDGQDAGVWELPGERRFFGESAFTIPGELLTADRATLRFEVIPGRAAIAGSSFFYWILVPAESG